MLDRKRPVLVWLILFYFQFMFALWVASTMLSLPDAIPLDPATRASVENMTSFD